MKDAREAGRCPSGVFVFSFQIIFFLILFMYCFEQCRISLISLSEYPASRSLKIHIHIVWNFLLLLRCFGNFPCIKHKTYGKGHFGYRKDIHLHYCNSSYYVPR